MNNTYTDGSGVLHSRFTGQCENEVDICCDREDDLRNFTPTSCGRRNTNGIGFQVKNAVDESQFGEFPWMVALTELKDFRKTYVCGASLIHPSVVLTGAHCVHDKKAEHLVARVGEWDTQTENEILPSFDHSVNQIIIHSEFGVSNLFNDIALLILDKPVKLSAHVNTICLPPQNFKFDKMNCLASGWGKDKFESNGTYRVNLKKLQLPIMPAKECQDRLRTTLLGKRFKLNPSFICAGGEKEDTCTGQYTNYYHIILLILSLLSDTLN
jgi:plasma kallikrein